ncbi:MAG: hypothetical protein JWM54_1919 [Acidobacteriaceae bacterium]|nr:hypothetical protein [Acidobacteriaceae bacterium]
MSEEWIALFLTAGILALLIGCVPCMSFVDRSVRSVRFRRASESPAPRISEEILEPSTTR